jgi:predicted RNase H-related nuclease YkuK (DUF458 family)
LWHASLDPNAIFKHRDSPTALTASYSQAHSAATAQLAIIAEAVKSLVSALLVLHAMVLQPWILIHLDMNAQRANIVTVVLLLVCRVLLKR